MEGSGKMVVTAVGMNSQAGIIVALLGATANELDNATAAANTGKQHTCLSNMTNTVCARHQMIIAAGSTSGAVYRTCQFLWIFHMRVRRLICYLLFVNFQIFEPCCLRQMFLSVQPWNDVKPSLVQRLNCCFQPCSVELPIAFRSPRWHRDVITPRRWSSAGRAVVPSELMWPSAHFCTRSETAELFA